MDDAKGLARPVRIIRIIARLNIGGPAIHVLLLTHYLNDSQFESRLVCGQIESAEGDMSYLADALDVHPTVLPHLGRSLSPWRDLLTVVQLVRLMRRFRPDVVHTHTAKAGFVGRVAAWLAGVPVRIHTFHGHVFQGYFGRRKTQLFLTLERLGARLSTRIITISPALRDELVNVYRVAPAEKFSVLSLGLDLRPLLEKPAESRFREAHRLPADARLVGIVGRLVPIKNHRLFLEAAALVRRQRSDVHFVVVGDGECRAGLEQAVQELGLSQDVSFVGWVQQVGEVLHELSVVALTSNNEGTPVSVIEAMVAGVPVVATAVGGVPDVLEGGRLGLLAAPGDAQGFAEAVLRALDGHHPDLALAREEALARYDIQRLVREMGELYRTAFTPPK